MKTLRATSVLLLLLPSALLAAPVAAQDDLRLSVYLVVFTDDDGPFKRDELEDSLVVALAQKPLRLDGEWKLTLRVRTTCVTDACSWQTRLEQWIAGGENPVARGKAKVSYWEVGGILTGRGRGMRARIVENVVAAIDEPLAYWLRLTEQQRACWVTQLENTPIDQPYGSACGVPAADERVAAEGQALADMTLGEPMDRMGKLTAVVGGVPLYPGTPASGKTSALRRKGQGGDRVQVLRHDNAWGMRYYLVRLSDGYVAWVYHTHLEIEE